MSFKKRSNHHWMQPGVHREKLVQLITLSFLTGKKKNAVDALSLKHLTRFPIIAQIR